MVYNKCVDDIYTLYHIDRELLFQRILVNEARKHEIGYKIAKLRIRGLGIRLNLKPDDLEKGAKEIGVSTEELEEFMYEVERELFEQKYSKNKSSK